MAGWMRAYGLAGVVVLSVVASGSGAFPLGPPVASLSIHVDPAPPGPDLPLNDFQRAPTCVEFGGIPGETYTLVIYARAVDDVDRYVVKAETIRTLVKNANAVVYDAGVATGTAVDLKVACSRGQITVMNEVLPHNMATANYNTIMTDLRLSGYASPLVKYWVWYDDPGACGCGGVALLWGDDSPLPTNLNNGWSPLSMFAITFGYDSSNIMLHELSHTLGAVQNSSPHSTKAGHCYDGTDVMCYNDGGANGGLYKSTFCTPRQYDCNHDDYFHTNPPAGSYLADNWNLGSRWNRFFDFEDTLIGPVPMP